MGDSLLTLGMEVDPADGAVHLVETDVVEAFEACAVDLPHPVVRDKEGLLPSHEDVFALVEVLQVEVFFLGVTREGSEGREARPVLHIGSVGRAPGGVLGAEGVVRTDDFAFEIGCQAWVVFGQA